MTVTMRAPEPWWSASHRRCSTFLLHTVERCDHAAYPVLSKHYRRCLLAVNVGG